MVNMVMEVAVAVPSLVTLLQAAPGCGAVCAPPVVGLDWVAAEEEEEDEPAPAPAASVEPSAALRAGSASA